MSELTREQIQIRCDGTIKVIHAIFKKTEGLFGISETEFDRAFAAYYEAQSLIRCGKLAEAEYTRVNSITLANKVMIELTKNFYAENGSILNGSTMKVDIKIKKAEDLLAESNQKEIGELCEDVVQIITKAAAQAREETERIIRKKENIKLRIDDFIRKIQGSSVDKRTTLEQMILPVMLGMDIWPKDHDLTSRMLDASERYLDSTKRYYFSDAFSEKKSHTTEITININADDIIEEPSTSPEEVAV